MFGTVTFVKNYTSREHSRFHSQPYSLRGIFFSLLRFLVAVPYGLLCSSPALTQIRLVGFPLEDAALEGAVPSLQGRTYWITLCLLQDIFRKQNISTWIFGRCTSKFWKEDRKPWKATSRTWPNWFITFILHYAIYDACSPGTSQSTRTGSRIMACRCCAEGAGLVQKRMWDSWRAASCSALSISHQHFQLEDLPFQNSADKMKFAGGRRKDTLNRYSWAADVHSTDFFVILCLVFEQGRLNFVIQYRKEQQYLLSWILFGVQWDYSDLHSLDTQPMVFITY